MLKPPRRPRAQLLAALVCAAGLAGPAAAVRLDADPSQSSITPPGGAPEPMSGEVTVQVGAPAPSGNSSFDVVGLGLTTASYDVTLQPIANPGLGVVASNGSFLIPTLFLRVDDGVSPFDLALPDITGLLLGRGPGCPFDTCLETSFEIDTGGGSLIEVSLRAVPEPSTGMLVALGFTMLAMRSRRGAR